MSSRCLALRDVGETDKKAWPCPCGLLRQGSELTGKHMICGKWHCFGSWGKEEVSFLESRLTVQPGFPGTALVCALCSAGLNTTPLALRSLPVWEINYVIPWNKAALEGFTGEEVFGMTVATQESSGGIIYISKSIGRRLRLAFQVYFSHVTVDS